MQSDLRRAWAVIALLMAPCGALFAAGIAGLTTACENGCPYPSAQLWVAFGGLVPAIGLLLAVVRRNRTLALIFLLSGVLIYLLWGLLNDAATHGWSHLQVF